ncbi:hypothetical protein LTR37_001854 [Vermiconidia calcicola]|uniref:Uncharacterized protein n=1 Tax=Vermiconidia calcicola TaxID=1690605 RepID=A0ACC3NUD9_9PEZI|nr:hypothetical protein LTR37_001854 [Vermiconidia calcicola]
MAKTIPNDIFQFSLLSAFDGGLKDGGPPVGFLKNHGNHGVGIFEDEEQSDMIQIDGVTYSFEEDGEATEAEKDDQLPFCMVTVFSPTQRVKPPKQTTSKKLKEDDWKVWVYLYKAKDILGREGHDFRVQYTELAA